MGLVRANVCRNPVGFYASVSLQRLLHIAACGYQLSCRFSNHCYKGRSRCLLSNPSDNRQRIRGSIVLYRLRGRQVSKVSLNTYRIHSLLNAHALPCYIIRCYAYQENLKDLKSDYSKLSPSTFRPTLQLVR